MEFFVNNGRRIVLKQDDPDTPVNVTVWGVPHEDYTECEQEYTIMPSDFVMILNWYQHQKRTGNTDLNF